MSPRLTIRSFLRRRRRRRVRIGLAIGADQVVAVELGRGVATPTPARVHTRTLAPASGDGQWPDLTSAMRDLVAALDADSVVTHVGLLPSLAKAKVIRVPALRDRDLESLVTRNVRRYFILKGTQPAVADVARLERGASGETVSAVATCADRSVLETIESCLREAGVRIERIVAAPLAVIEVVRRRISAIRRHTAIVAVNAAGWSEVIELRDGRPALLQSADGTSAAVAKRVEGLLTSPSGPTATAHGVVVADADRREDTKRACISAVADAAPAEWTSLDDLEPAAMVAYGAVLVPEGTPLLLTDTIRRARARMNRIRLTSLVAAATALLALAANLHLVNLRREFESVAAERRDIAAPVARALELRRSVETVRSRLAAVAEVESATVTWVPAFAALALALPDSAYLVSMSTDGIDVRLAGIANAAAAVIPALEASPFLSNVSLTVARRNETGGGAERFDVALTLEPGAGRGPAIETGANR